MEAKHIQHLYWRAGFGLGWNDFKEIENKSKKKILSKLFSNSESTKPLKIDFSKYLASMNTPKKEMSEEEKRDIQKYLREKEIEINNEWINRLNQNENVLREKMTLFWANVFVCSDNNSYDILQYNNVLRKNALGHFGDFTKAISHESSMIKYLNNKQNKKDRPNENFARELMELFTLGAGNYSENDIKESARAFTGWSNKPDGEFFLAKKQHDFGEKTFFGKTGDFDGDDIIDIILEQRQCAKFICTKVYKYFVNPIVNEKNLEEITDVFYKNYQIEKLMFHLFNSDWFYDEENIGSKIKSPIELLVGMQQIVPATFEKKRQLQYMQKMMGQILLKPVNVSGWKGDKSWIDSNTLMFRLKLPSLVLNNAKINLNEKGDIEGTFEEFYKKNKGNSYVKTTVNWEKFNAEYQKISAEELKKLLIISPIDLDTEKFLAKIPSTNIKDYCIQLMSIPEYQLC